MAGGQPFAHRIVLVVLLWPAMAMGALLARREALSAPARYAFFAAVALLTLQPLVPGGQNQRTLQMIGVDFWATCLLTMALSISALGDVRKHATTVKGGNHTADVA